MDREILKQWVTLLEFKADAEKARDLIFNVRSIGTALLAVAAAMEAASLALNAAVLKTSEGLRQLGEAAERADVTAEQLHAFGYAAKQIGVDSDAAKSAFQRFSDWMEKGPGQQLARRLGINPLEEDNKTLRNRFKLLEEMSKAIEKLPEREASVYREAMGFGSPELRNITRHHEELSKFYDEEIKRVADLGINLKQATKDAQELGQEQTRLKQVLDDIWNGVTEHVSPRLKAVIKEIREAVEEHAPRIKEMLIWVADGIIDYFIKPSWDFLKWWHSQKNIQIAPQLGDGPGNWWDASIAKMQEWREALNRLGQWIVDHFVSPVKKAIEDTADALRKYQESRPQQVYPGGTSRGEAGGAAAAPEAPSAPGGAGAGTSPTTPPGGSATTTPPAEKKSFWDRFRPRRRDAAPGTPGAESGTPPAAPTPDTKTGPVEGSGGPHHIFGTLDVEGTKYQFGSGSEANAPIPPGSYPITPEAIGPWGRAHGAIGINNNAIWDASLGRMRRGIELHSGSSDQLLTEGCMAIAGDQWPQFKAHVRAMIQKHGSVFLNVDKQGNASVTPMGAIGAMANRVAPGATIRGAPTRENAEAMSRAGTGSKLLDVRGRERYNNVSAATNSFSNSQNVSINVQGDKGGPAEKDTQMAGPRDQSRMHKNLQGSYQ